MNRNYKFPRQKPDEGSKKRNSDNYNQLKSQALQGRQNSCENTLKKGTKYSGASHCIDLYNTVDPRSNLIKPLYENHQTATGNWGFLTRIPTFWVQLK